MGSKRECSSDNHKFSSQQANWGFPDFVKRAEVLDPSKGYLVDGKLSIEVDIQVFTEEKPIWKPPRKGCKDTMLHLLESQQFTDITFVVDDQKFPAHRCILAANAPYLCSLPEGKWAQEDIKITGVDPAVFKGLLRFVYLLEIPDVSLLRKQGRGLLEVADRFECKSLKLEVEASLVESILDENNACDWLLFAESHSCALLKEAAIKVISKHMDTITTTSGWVLLKSSARLLAEIMEAQPNHKEALFCVNDDNVENMGVASLRDRLAEKGLDTDGTREILVKRLKKADACQLL